LAVASDWLRARRGGTSFAVERFVTVLVIACPHALGLAVPLVVAISTTMGARSGVLVRDRRGLEEARLLDTVVFDKTGTLTLGEHRVVAMLATSGADENAALRLAAAVERDAEHPVGRAIVASARERGLDLAGSGFRDPITPEALVEGRRLTVGGQLITRLGVAIPAPNMSSPRGGVLARLST
jgi:Cu2+-exporting ATPase